MNKKWLEFIMKNCSEAPDGNSWYNIIPEELLNFLIENDLIK